MIWFLLSVNNKKCLHNIHPVGSCERISWLSTDWCFSFSWTRWWRKNKTKHRTTSELYVCVGIGHDLIVSALPTLGHCVSVWMCFFFTRLVSCAIIFNHQTWWYRAHIEIYYLHTIIIAVSNASFENYTVGYEIMFCGWVKPSWQWPCDVIGF